MLFACGWWVHGFFWLAILSYAPNIDMQNSPRANVRTYRLAPSIGTHDPTTLASITNPVPANDPSQPIGTSGNGFKTRSTRNQVQTSAKMAIHLPIHDVLSLAGSHWRCNNATRRDVAARRTRRTLCSTSLQPPQPGQRNPRRAPVRDDHAGRNAGRARSDCQFCSPGYR